MKKKWAHDKASRHVAAVQAKRRPYGLTYCSACDFLGVAPKYRAVYIEAEGAVT